MAENNANRDLKLEVDRLREALELAVRVFERIPEFAFEERKCKEALESIPRVDILKRVRREALEEASGIAANLVGRGEQWDDACHTIVEEIRQVAEEIT